MGKRTYKTSEVLILATIVKIFEILKENTFLHNFSCKLSESINLSEAIMDRIGNSIYWGDDFVSISIDRDGESIWGLATTNNDSPDVIHVIIDYEEKLFIFRRKKSKTFLEKVL